jgi:hypothetical protein
MTRATTQNRFRGRSPHAAERTKPSHTQPSGTQSSRYAAGTGTGETLGEIQQPVRRSDR